MFPKTLVYARMCNLNKLLGIPGVPTDIHLNTPGQIAFWANLDDL